MNIFVLLLLLSSHYYFILENVFKRMTDAVLIEIQTSETFNELRSRER